MNLNTTSHVFCPRHVFTGEKVAVKVIDKLKLDQATRMQMLQVKHPKMIIMVKIIMMMKMIMMVIKVKNHDQNHIDVVLLESIAC